MALDDLNITSLQDVATMTAVLNIMTEDVNWLRNISLVNIIIIILPSLSPTGRKPAGLLSWYCETTFL